MFGQRGFNAGFFATANKDNDYLISLNNGIDNFETIFEENIFEKTDAAVDSLFMNLEQEEAVNSGSPIEQEDNLTVTEEMVSQFLGSGKITNSDGRHQVNNSSSQNESQEKSKRPRNILRTEIESLQKKLKTAENRIIHLYTKVYMEKKEALNVVEKQNEELKRQVETLESGLPKDTRLLVQQKLALESELKLLKEQNEDLIFDAKVSEDERRAVSSERLRERKFLLSLHPEFFSSQGKSLTSQLQYLKNQYVQLDFKHKQNESSLEEKDKILKFFHSKWQQETKRALLLEEENTKLKKQLFEAVTSTKSQNQEINTDQNFSGNNVPQQPKPANIIDLEAYQAPMPKSSNTPASGVSIGELGLWKTLNGDQSNIAQFAQSASKDKSPEVRRDDECRIS